MKPSVLIVRAAGTNCDLETEHAFAAAGALTRRMYIDEVKKRSIRNYQILVFPGGFTYGDDISAGKILANEIKCKLRDKVLAFIERGNLILGICNGFQLLVKCGILPAFKDYFEPQSVSLITNDSERFEDRWVHMRVLDNVCVFTKGLKPIITMPVAHAEGKFVVRNRKVLKRIRNHIVFQYVDENGEPAGYPDNPNGSMLDIAGITDRSGRILGLMPHPERHISYLQHPSHTRRKTDRLGDGFHIFSNAVKYFS
jgi:phosphoribosylformylglycinamidine synthase I